MTAKANEIIALLKELDSEYECGKRLTHLEAWANGPTTIGVRSFREVVEREQSPASKAAQVDLEEVADYLERAKWVPHEYCRERP